MESLMDEPKSGLREFQDQQANQGWRIQLIPFDGGTQTIAVKANPFALIGALVFVVCLLLGVRSENGNYVYGALGGFVLALLSLLFSGRGRRRGWKKIEAQCVDREIREVYAQPRPGEGPTWAFRLLCKFDYEGKNYLVTPGFWRTFATEHGIRSFLSKEISSEGRCFLYVNPRIPLETELAAGDIAEKLLH